MNKRWKERNEKKEVRCNLLCDGCHKQTEMKNVSYDEFFFYS